MVTPSKLPLRVLSKEEIGRHVEQLGELLRLRLADRSLSAHDLASVVGRKSCNVVWVVHRPQ